MRKLLQVVVCGLAAASFSVLAADDTEKSTGSKANAAGNTGAGASADMKADKEPKKAKKDERATDKHDKRDSPASGGTRAEPAPAPAPTPVETEKK